MAAKRGKRRKRPKSLHPLLFPTLAGLAILIASAFLIGRYYSAANRGAAKGNPIYPYQSTSGPERDRWPGERAANKEGAGTGIGEVAIVMDDLGPNLAYARELMDIHKGLTLAIIPWEDASDSINEEALSRGMETILHQPMEPHEAVTGRSLRGMLRLNMSDNEIRRVLLENIQAYPGISGMNNHMGSAFTEDLHAMNVVAGVLKGEGLIFMDSLTSPDTKGGRAAQMADLKFYRRDVFLDNETDYDYMKGMWNTFLRRAEKHGRAVLIAHGRRESIDFLRESLPDLERLGLALVPLSRLKTETPHVDS